MSSSQSPEPAPSRPRAKRRVRYLRRRLMLLTLMTLATTEFGIILLLLALRARHLLIEKREPMPLVYFYIPSPNCDDRPPDVEVDCVVLHATVAPTTQEVINTFLVPRSGVSAHFVVGKDGQVIQMVPVERKAWHAGPSEWAGRVRVNDFSVGIEMVNRNNGRDPYPEAQIQAVAGIIRFLRSRYPIPDDRIVSHAEVARPLGRKNDPRNFNFNRIRTLANTKALTP